MSRINNASKLCVAIIAMMIVLSSLQSPVSAQIESLDPIVVMYDASHNQQFSATDSDGGLKLILDMVNDSTRYIVRINDHPLNETILNNVDILIFADPDKITEFEQAESEAICAMMENGSSLLLLGDPTVDQNSTYWNNPALQDFGENVALNDLLDSLNVTGPRFSLNYTANDYVWGDSMFDYEMSLNSSYPAIIEFDSTTWDTTHPIFNDINTILTMTATITPIDHESSIATGYESSFAQWRRGPNTFANITYPNMTLADYAEAPLSYSAINGTFPSWLSAFEFNQSKIAMVGSTLMFTGKFLDMPESEDQWFYQADNSRLFMNLMNWLSEGFTESPSAINEMFIISSVILIIGVAFYFVKKK
ncbi:MAG: Gldg family protein [Candidatus Thorarchaeota archaeon]